MFGGLGESEGVGRRAGHAIGPQQDEVADLAVLDPIEQLLPRRRSAGTSGRRRPSGSSSRDSLGQGQHLARGGAVDRGGLFHEDVQPLLDRVGEMDPAEGRRRGHDHDVAGPEAVHRFLVAVKADELAVGRHVDLVWALLQ